MAGTDEVGITFTRSCKNRRKLLLPKFFANLKTMSPNSGALVGNKIVRATKSSLGCVKLVASIYVGGKGMMMVKTEDREGPITRQKGLRTDRFDGARDVPSALTRKSKHSDHGDEGDLVTLLSLLLARRGLGVTDTRHMVFAHLGFATDGQKFVDEYAKTCAQVYEDLLAFEWSPS